MAGNIAATLTGTTAGTAVPGSISALVTIRTIGAAGTVGGGLVQVHSAASALASSTTAVAVDTTANKIIELAFISGNATNTYTFQYAVIEKISAA